MPYKDKNNNNIWRQNYRRRWRINGNCQECGLPSFPFTRCFKCRKIRSLWSRNYRRRLKRNEITKKL